MASAPSSTPGAIVLAPMDVEISTSESLINAIGGPALLQGAYSGSGGAITTGYGTGNARSFANGDTAQYAFPFSNVSLLFASVLSPYTIGCDAKFTAPPSSNAPLVVLNQTSAVSGMYIYVSTSGVIHAGITTTSSTFEFNSTSWPTDGNYYEARLVYLGNAVSTNTSNTLLFFFGLSGTVLPLIGTITNSGGLTFTQSTYNQFVVHDSTFATGGVAGIDNPYLIAGTWLGTRPRIQNAPKRPDSPWNLARLTRGSLGLGARRQQVLLKQQSSTSSPPTNGFGQGLG